MKITAILKGLDGAETRKPIEVEDPTEPPGVIVVDNLGEALRAFYSTGMRERGTALHYTECSTLTMHL